MDPVAKLLSEEWGCVGMRVGNTIFIGEEASIYATTLVSWKVFELFFGVCLC